MCVVFLCSVFIVFRLVFFCFRLKTHDFDAYTQRHTDTGTDTSNHLNYCQFECEGTGLAVVLLASHKHSHTLIQSFTYKLLLSKQNLLFAFFIFVRIRISFDILQFFPPSPSCFFLILLVFLVDVTLRFVLWSWEFSRSAATCVWFVQFWHFIFEIVRARRLIM